MRDKVCVCVREREGESVCLCVCVYVCVYVRMRVRVRVRRLVNCEAPLVSIWMGRATHLDDHITHMDG